MLLLQEKSHTATQIVNNKLMLYRRGDVGRGIRCRWAPVVILSQCSRPVKIDILAWVERLYFESCRAMWCPDSVFLVFSWRGTSITCTLRPIPALAPA